MNRRMEATMAGSAEAGHRPNTARRAGYVIAAVVDAALLYLLNVRPGWEALPFLTADAHRVLWLVDLSLVAGLVVNVVYALRDAPWPKSLGDLVTTGIGLVVSIRLLRVFPFDVGTRSFDWAIIVRALLVVAVVGAAIGLIGRFVSLVRALLPKKRRDR